LNFTDDEPSDFVAKNWQIDFLFGESYDEKVLSAISCNGTNHTIFNSKIFDFYFSGNSKVSVKVIV